MLLEQHAMLPGHEAEEAGWSPEKIANEAELCKTRLHRALEQEMEDDPYARHLYQQRFAQADARSAQLTDARERHALWQTLEQEWQQGIVPGLPEVFAQRRSAATYYGLFRLALGETHFAAANAAQLSAYVEQALAIDEVVQPAIRENTLNPEHMDSILVQKLLPRLYLMLGMEPARTVCAQIVQIARLRARALQRTR